MTALYMRGEQGHLVMGFDYRAGNKGLGPGPEGYPLGTAFAYDMGKILKDDN